MGRAERYAALALSRAGRHSEVAEVIALLRWPLSGWPSARGPGRSAPRSPPPSSPCAGVDAANSAGDYRRALDLALRVERPERTPPAMHSRYLLNVARAQTCDWRSADAVGTLLRAEQVAPEALAHQTVARMIVGELLPRRNRHRLPGLAPLAARLRVAA
ncbi:hypothetical protein GCM10010123_37260 [Pilimelia anulata]|uniref:Uncharacterized protein n=1 Tax=Pilimelia anulata TaxID=53371 RepID=A0A8J3FC10_9ACTN|nr:hypothetical protein [Pilimelia anulata]GGK03854.1 hypothetical protein GCM10010123_37260 [Pilimelia anulata]